MWGLLKLFFEHYEQCIHMSKMKFYLNEKLRYNVRDLKNLYKVANTHWIFELGFEF